MRSARALGGGNGGRRSKPDDPTGKGRRGACACVCAGREKNRVAPTRRLFLFFLSLSHPRGRSLSLFSFFLLFPWWGGAGRRVRDREGCSSCALRGGWTPPPYSFSFVGTRMVSSCFSHSLFTPLNSRSSGLSDQGAPFSFRPCISRAAPWTATRCVPCLLFFHLERARTLSCEKSAGRWGWEVARPASARAAPHNLRAA